MSFLAPWFLLGALAVAGPLLFHLIRRSARDQTPFSSLMFLHPTPPQSVRRRKLEHRLLLALRCLCLILIAAAFARPLFPHPAPSPEPAAGGRQFILLVDTSASMRRNGLWESARAVAGHYFDQAEPADQVAVMAFDRQARPLVNFAEWSAWAPSERAARARQRLAAVSPGWLGTRLGSALTTAADGFETKLMAAGPPQSRALILITDLQDGAGLDGLQGYEWPAGVRVILERVKGKPESNAGLEILDPAAGIAGDGAGVRVRLANAADSAREKFRLAWSGGGPSAEVYLAPGQSRTMPAPKPPAGATVAKLELSGDEVPFDNSSYYVAPETERVGVAYFGTEAPDDPAGLRYYLQRVFPLMPRRTVELVSADALDGAAFAIVSGDQPPARCAALRRWLAGGKSALLVLDPVAAASTLAALLDLPSPRLTEAGGDFALLGDIAFANPIFAPFNDPRFSDFSHIHFWRHRRWVIPAAVSSSVLAKFDDGSPALAQVAVGKGRLLVLASGWAPADSQLAVSSKFPPLMQTILDWSGATAPVHFQFETGDAIPAPVSSGGPVRWQNPRGESVTLPAGAAFAGTGEPGVYRATWDNGFRQFAVNVPVEESRTGPMPVDDLARLGVPLGPLGAPAAAPSPLQQRELSRAELENRQKPWRWLLGAALAMALMEIILGGRLARRVTASPRTT